MSACSPDLAIQDNHAEVIIRIPGNPVPKGRARAFLRGKHIRHYTPEKTRVWEGVARIAAGEAMRGRPLIDGPVRLYVMATFAPPSSWPKWRQDLMGHDGVAHTTKPDLDNLVKAAKDACNGIVWRDDSQVMTIEATKRYGETPALEMRIVRDDRLGAREKRR